jgi:peptidoglycan-N-acetylglucosamine deacetylase
MPERRTLVSVDLDDVACYHAIHGLEDPSPSMLPLVLERCLPRFLDLFAELDVLATFFVVGRDLERDLEEGGRGADVLRRALAEGHELANHGHAHAYDLVTWSSSAIRADLRACDGLLRQIGAEPVGFRAPGYTHDVGLLDAVRELGYAYDSSSLPSPPYYVAKLGAIALYALLRRPSRSLVRGGSAFLGPTRPHRRGDLWELPMSVTPHLRLPLIGTTLLGAPSPIARRLSSIARDLPYFHLELHALDLADGERDGYAPQLRRRQPELRTPLALKRSRLVRLLAGRSLTGRGPTQRLCDLAAELDRTGQASPAEALERRR